MRPKDESDFSTTKQRPIQQRYELPLEYQIKVFLNFLQTLPRSLLTQHGPVLTSLRRELSSVAPPSAKLIEEFQLSQALPIKSNQPLKEAAINAINLAERLFSTTNLKSILKRCINLSEAKQETDVDRTRGLKLDKIDTLHPEFETYYRISKQYGDHCLHHYQVKKKEPLLFKEPRFLTKLEELAHYKSSSEEKGNILYLGYEGSRIKGGRTLGVLNGNTLQLWAQQGSSEALLSAIDEEGSQQAKFEKQKAYDNKFKLLHTFYDHCGKVTSLSFSSDEFYVVTGCTDRKVRLWCTRLKTLLAEFKGHMSVIWDVDFNSSGYYIVSGGADGLVMLWRTTFHSAQRIFNHGQDVYKVAFSRDSDMVFSAGENGTVKIWKIEDASCLSVINFGSPVDNFDLSFSGAVIAVHEGSGLVTCIDLIKGEKLVSFKVESDVLGNHSGGIHDLCLSADEKELVCVTAQHIFLYSMENLIEWQAEASYSAMTGSKQSRQVQPKQLILMNRDTNITFCRYVEKGLLVVAGTVVPL